MLKKLGTNTNSAINMFLRQCDREQGLVFIPSMNTTPSKELLESLQEIEDYKNGKIELDSYDDVKSLRSALTDD
ncbi:relB/DinJ family addiction module antitoxin [Firmicutes bacterium CAG:321]|nr:relB/DinJ family addiction module antitoxin [Firmicutes bacterium CAG:321]